MSKLTNSNLNIMRLQKMQNPNPNSSHLFIGNRNQHQLPCSFPSQPAFVHSSLNSVPARFYGYRCVTFCVGSYTRRELKELKKRLMSELQRVRIFRQWICSMSIPKKNHHQPEMTLPAAPGMFSTGKERQKIAVGRKRTNPLQPVRDTKKRCGRITNTQKRKIMMRGCDQILGKLMKHKYGWVFNSPVDAAALKLREYHNIINNPMDLGTIKLKLAKNEYESPVAFASDVRLTFQNAMVYNGNGSDVFIMAQRLLLLFEDMFKSNHQKVVVNRVKKQNRPANAPISVENQAIIVEGPVVRVLNKPVMTAEEKADLAASFWDLQLGPEGMNQIMGIVKKGVLGLEHQGDEVEIDLAVLDNDTLWELHEFMNSTRNKLVTNLISSAHTHYSAGNEHEHEHEHEQQVVEEDVDIGEEMQPTIFPVVEIEKDNVNISSGDSSSSSGNKQESSL
ncbi:hypothetical protein R6Q57_030015 [Mikania cordata]